MQIINFIYWCWNDYWRGLNFGLILYVGNYFSKYFEDELKKDNGEEFLLNAIKDFNYAIKSFSENKARPRSSSF